MASEFQGLMTELILMQVKCEETQFERIHDLHTTFSISKSTFDHPRWVSDALLSKFCGLLAFDTFEEVYDDDLMNIQRSILIHHYLCLMRSTIYLCLSYPPVITARRRSSSRSHRTVPPVPQIVSVPKDERSDLFTNVRPR